MENGLVLCVPDIHVPYEDKRAWNLMLEVVDYIKPSLTIQLGDFPDNKAFSRHGHKFGERKGDPERDMEKVKKAAQDLKRAARKKIKFLRGNHCEWFSRYVAENAPALEPFVPTYSQLYGVSDTTVPYQEILKVGKVGYVHDLGHSGKQALHQTLATAGHCIVFGHTHRLGVVYSGTTEARDRWFAMNCGWLGDKREIKYMNASAMRDWQLGFGAVEYADGLAFATPVPIVNNKCRFRGKTFKG